MMSVQASSEHFCSPRDDFGPYDGVEVGYPSEWEDLLLPFTDNNTERTPVMCGLTPTLYVNVPPSTIRAIIQKHGGMTADSGKLPQMGTSHGTGEYAPLFFEKVLSKYQIKILTSGN